MSKEGMELRNHARFELFEYAMVYPEGTYEPKRSVIVDISIGGAQVRSRYTFEAGSSVILNIAQPGEEDPVQVHAEVRYCNLIPDSDLYAVGFRFTPTSQAEREHIVTYVHEFFKLQGEMLLGENSA
jgi:c-di-GMP-binding flagellar brake protein YcgR